MAPKKSSKRRSVNSPGVEPAKKKLRRSNEIPEGAIEVSVTLYTEEMLRLAAEIVLCGLFAWKENLPAPKFDLKGHAEKLKRQPEAVRRRSRRRWDGARLCEAVLLGWVV